MGIVYSETLPSVGEIDGDVRKLGNVSYVIVFVLPNGFVTRVTFIAAKWSMFSTINIYKEWMRILV